MRILRRLRMPNLSVCKDCPDNDDFYGCMNQDCEVYQDMKAEADYEYKKDMEDEN